MTQKELLYLEDAIGHEKNIIKICQETINTLQDSNLISFLKNELQKHENRYQQLMNTLEAKANV